MFVSFLLGWILCRKKYQLLLKKYKTNPDTIQTIKLPTKAGGLDDSENKEKAVITVPNKEPKNTTISTNLAITIKSSNIIQIDLTLSYKMDHVKKRHVSSPVVLSNFNVFSRELI